MVVAVREVALRAAQAPAVVEAREVALPAGLVQPARQEVVAAVRTREAADREAAQEIHPATAPAVPSTRPAMAPVVPQRRPAAGLPSLQMVRAIQTCLAIRICLAMAPVPRRCHPTVLAALIPIPPAPPRPLARATVPLLPMPPDQLGAGARSSGLCFYNLSTTWTTPSSPLFCSAKPRLRQSLMASSSMPRSLPAKI